MAEAGVDIARRRASRCSRYWGGRAIGSDGLADAAGGPAPGFAGRRQQIPRIDTRPAVPSLDDEERLGSFRRGRDRTVSGRIVPLVRREALDPGDGPSKG